MATFCSDDLVADDRLLKRANVWSSRGILQKHHQKMTGVAFRLAGKPNLGCGTCVVRAPQKLLAVLLSLAANPSGAVGLLVFAFASVAIGRWVQAYDEAGHFYTAVTIEHYMAPPVSGTALDDAVLIGFCAQLPDLTREFDAITMWSNAARSSPIAAGIFGAFGQCWGSEMHHLVSVHHYLHGLTGSASQPVTDAAIAMIGGFRSSATRSDPNTVCAAGLAVHLLGDSFAHRRLDSPDRMYASGMGHFRDGTVPDHVGYVDGTRDRSPLWSTYTRTLASGLHLTVMQDSWKALDTLTKKNLTGGATKKPYDKAKIIDALKSTLGQPKDVLVWARYQPALEHWNDGALTVSKTFDDVVKAYTPPGWDKLKYGTVWQTYLRSATTTFGQRIPPICDPEEVGR